MAPRKRGDRRLRRKSILRSRTLSQPVREALSADYCPFATMFKAKMFVRPRVGRFPLKKKRSTSKSSTGIPEIALQTRPRSKHCPETVAGLSRAMRSRFFQKPQSNRRNQKPQIQVCQSDNPPRGCWSALPSVQKSPERIA